MRRWMTRGAVLAGLVLAAFLAGRFTSRDDRPAPAREAHGAVHAPSAPLVAWPQSAPVAAIGRDELRGIIREELAHVGVSGAASGPAADRDVAAEPAPESAEEAAALDTPEQRAAAAQSEALLQAAIGKSRWTVADGERWAAIAAGLSPPSRFEAERQLIVAINRDQLVLEPGAFPAAPIASR